jgi:hypothetical protein
MGCDIHLHSEIKINGKWEHYSAIEVDRDYMLFGLMAGVRDSKVTPICQPQGLPDNLSVVTKLDYERMKDDAHSMSYYNSTLIYELEKAIEDNREFLFNSKFGYLFGNAYGQFINYPNDYPEEIEDIRFVFWFDN